MGQSTVRFLPKKNDTDTEPHRLVYNRLYSINTMPIRQDDNQPIRRFGIVNIILIGVGALLIFSSLFPNQNMQIPRVPYSLFIDQVNDGEVKRAYITQEQIRYELNGAEEGAPSVLATTPIFDMDLPQRLESKVLNSLLLLLKNLISSQPF